MIARIIALRRQLVKPFKHFSQVITIKVRINCIDSYQAGQNPVVRVYGPDELGRSTVVHIHGSFPYFYLATVTEPNEQLARDIHNRIDSAMSKAYKRKQPFVHRISIVEATSIYGYHQKPANYLKIELRNPVFVNKCADLIFNGLVEGASQPFECHIPYLLHFMADHNLYGCNWLQFDKFRKQTSIALVREVDIDCADIAGEVFSSQREIASLGELQVADQALRKRLGERDFNLKLEFGEYRQIEWENIDRMRASLEDRFGSVAASQMGTQPPSNRGLSLNQELSLVATQATQLDEHEVIAGLGSEHIRHAEEIASSVVGNGQKCMVLFSSSPTAEKVRNTYGICPTKSSFYSNPKDVPFFPFTYGGKVHSVQGIQPSNLPTFTTKGASNPLQAYLNDFETTRPLEPPTMFQLGQLPPRRGQVEAWQATMSSASFDSFKMPSMPQAHAGDDMKLLCVEVCTSVRPGKTPFPEKDPIVAIVWATCSDSGTLTGEEVEILQRLIDLVHQQDPDLLGGFEISKFSWGYIAERYSIIFDEVLDLGRLKPGHAVAYAEALVHPGRYSLDLWSVLRHEVSLYRYSLESVVWHVLHLSTPHLGFEDLWGLWLEDPDAALAYLHRRLSLTLQIVQHLELVSKYAEQSRLIGIDFNSSITRGSQYKVEAVLCRISKRRKFLLLSPSRKQVANQLALEYIPLVMEPKSAFYTDPVCVLDFRSLYPSIVMAFNLCYSTCIGRIQLWKGKNKLGVIEDLAIPPGLSAKDLFIAPNGIVYVKARVRKSIVASMLSEILESRFMVKASMRFGDVRHKRNMNSKQTALKLLANVTYGYISASFSGRMPCAEIADSIVSIGRELLVASIAKIEGQQFGSIIPKVVYGDTDSLFVLLKGASRAHAFDIGQKLAQIITAGLPQPMELEMEKVYDPCILLTKKRYVGNSYSSPQSEAFFDAKGTETIRRDGVPILQQLEKRVLQKLFSTLDLSLVKAYFCQEMQRILAHRVLPSQFLFSQKVRLGNYKAAQSNLPGGAVVSLKAAADDPGALPQYNERVSFLVTAGPGLINDRVVAPLDFVKSNNLSIDVDYYINQVIIPPLERLLGVAGADCRSWYAQVPRPKRGIQGSLQCLMCLKRSDSPLCSHCTLPEALYILHARLKARQRTSDDLVATCKQCSSIWSQCQSLDCDVFYARAKIETEIEDAMDDLIKIETL